MTGDATTSGLQIREAHFPGRVPLDSYGNGGFRFADMSHRGSLLCLPSGIYGWAAEGPCDLVPAMFDKLFDERDDIELALIGTGRDLVYLSGPLLDALERDGIRGEPMATGAAARTYNVLLAEGRAVAAALLAVD